MPKLKLRGWSNWQRTCGYIALAAAAIWGLKFILVATLPDAPGIGFLSGFAFPLLGSLAVLVVGSGFAAPLVRGRAWWIAIPVAVICTFVFAIIANGIVYDHVDSYLNSHADSQLIKDEGAVLSTVAVMLIAGLLLLRPGANDAAAHTG